MTRRRKTLVAVLGAVVAAGCVERVEVLGPPARPDDGNGSETSVTDVALGDAHGCAVERTRLFCWGNNSSGELGLGDETARTTPALVAGAWRAVAAGAHHTCALDDLGRVACWGANERGQLGAGDREARSAPEFVTLPRPATAVTTDFSHTCALLSDASLHCWGKNDEGEMGQDDPFPGDQSTDADALTPVVVSGTWRAVDVGQGHTCAIRLDGTLWCWGRNTENELGDNDGIQIRVPVQVGADADWLAVDAGQSHTCGLRADRFAYCWGLNNSRSAGNGAPLGIAGVDRVETPTRLDAPSDLAALRTDTFHTCAVDRSSSTFCWGRNIEGQLGLGDQDLRETPELVDTGYRAVAVGRFTTCAVTSAGGLACTGENDDGQLGLGDLVERSVLTSVAFPP